MATQIQLKELTKRFDSTAPGGARAQRTAGAAGAGTLAVDHVNLTIEQGELFFLLGPSGCGKTTLLRMIAGFIEPTSGQILFDAGQGARDVTFLPPNKRNTGMVFQSYALWPHMSVAQNVAFGLDIRAVSAEEKSRRVREALDAVQMGPYAERRPSQLSGGQQQRVALARALVIRPDVLLLDEPLSNLDAKLRTELRSEIRRICKTAGITGVYVTHDQKEALSMADRVAVVNQGRIVQVAPPAQMYRRPRNRFVAEFLGETNLMPGRVVERTGENGGKLVVETPVGRLVSAAVSRDVDVEKAIDTRGGADLGQVLVSVRPEAIRLEKTSGMNTLFGTVRESTYLGETAQLVADLAGGAQGRVDDAGRPVPGVEWKIATLNPGLRAGDGQPITLSVSPDDVVVLPAPAAQA